MPSRQTPTPPPAGPNRRRPSPAMPNSWIFLVILATAMVALYVFNDANARSGAIDYSDFLQLINKDKVSKITIVGKNQIKGEVKNPKDVDEALAKKFEQT